MTVNLSYGQESLVYPGAFTPLPEVEAILQQTKPAGNADAGKLPVNMSECDDSYTIEVIMPVVKREDILLQVHDHILSIAVLHRDCRDFKKENLQLHEFDAECLERHILLPKYADAAFVSAEYKEGILNLHIPKAKHPQKKLTNRIVIY